jgi:hypothetical protein
VALLDGLSQLDKAMHDTLVHKASPTWLDLLSTMYGLPRVSAVESRYWRKALRAGNFAKRDSLGTIFSVCREALRGQDHTLPVKIRSGAPYDSRVYKYDGAGFVPADLFRMWEIGGVVYFCTGAATFSGGYTEYLEMAPWPGATWAGCVWSNLSDPPPSVSWYDTTATRLPFLLRGHSGKAELVLEESSNAPPTYLQDFFPATFAEVPPDGTTVTLFVGTAPIDGTLTTLSLSQGETLSMVVESVSGSTVTLSNVNPDLLPSGPWNFYIGAGTDNLFQYTGVTDNGDGTYTLTGVTLVSGSADDLAAGAQANVDLDPARGGDYQCKLFVNLTEEDAVELGASDRDVSSAVEVAVVEGDLIFLQVLGLSGSLPTVPLTNAIASVTLLRPAGEPLGGHLLDDASSDDSSTGPWPIYLSGGEADDWKRLLDQMIALGVEPVARTSTHLNSD